MAIFNHVIQSMRIKYTLYQGMDAFRNLGTALRNRRQHIIFLICAVFIGHMVLFINIIIFDEVPVDSTALISGNSKFVPVQHQCFPNEVFRRRLGRTFV